MPTETAQNNANSTQKLEEALNLVNETAKEKKEQLINLMEQKYSNLRVLLSDVALNNREILGQVRRMAEKKVRRNPLGTIGGVAAGSLLLGFLFGVSRSRQY
jgi:ElaB/YqjD/DUF883 family membrane-anchored ribosome-binding protein